MDQVVNRKKVLIVDDESIVRRTLHKLLTKEYIVLEAEDGEEAVNIARSQRPDLILLDLMMPKMDGYTSCHAIKTDPATKMIPVFMLTAIGHELNMKLSQKIGADGYITKPFDRRELLETVSKLLASSA